METEQTDDDTFDQAVTQEAPAAEPDPPTPAGPALAEEARARLEADIEAGVPITRIVRSYLEFMLARCGGNKVHTARRVGIDRRTIQRWAKSGMPKTVRSTQAERG